MIGEIGSAFALSLENLKLQQENRKLKDELSSERSKRLDAEKDVEVVKHEMAQLLESLRFVKH